MQDGQYAVLDSQYAATDKPQNQGGIFFYQTRKRFNYFVAKLNFTSFDF